MSTSPFDGIPLLKTEGVSHLFFLLTDCLFFVVHLTTCSLEFFLF